MAESFTSYEVDNDKSFRKALAKASEVTQDFRVPFGLIMKDFYKSEAAIFKLQGPGKYPPFQGKIDPETGMTRYQAEKRAAVGHDYPLLVRSGALSASLLGPSNPGSISKITNLSLEFGTSIKYGVYHQSDEPRKRVPLRKFLFIGPEAPEFVSMAQGRLERWVGYIQFHMGNEMTKAIEGRK